MALLITKSGMLTTVQDLGRLGERRFGLNPSGVMDRATARILNIILGNEETDAVLEIHFPACEIEFEADTVIAVGGADFSLHISGNPAAYGTTVFVPKGATVMFQKRISGQRTYLAVQGGLEIDEWRGSRSTNLVASIGGFAGRKLIAGDRIALSSPVATQRFEVGHSLRPQYDRLPIIRVVAGNEHDLLTALSERDLSNEKFTLTNDCDRMGFRLSGKPLHLLDARETVSAAVTFGTIQLLPDGQLIILMADHQTSGGYPRIGTVASADLPILAQRGPGDQICFELVSIASAEELSMQFERELSFLRVGCRLQGQNAKY